MPREELRGCHGMLLFTGGWSQRALLEPERMTAFGVSVA